MLSTISPKLAESSQSLTMPDLQGVYNSGSGGIIIVPHFAKEQSLLIDDHIHPF